VHEAGFDDLAAIDLQFRRLRQSQLVKVHVRDRHHQAQGVRVDGDTYLFL
jgi:hypothetical protein